MPSDIKGQGPKIAFDIDVVMDRVRESIAGYAPAAMFALADEGFSSPFEQLLACIISIRTYDEVTIPCAHRLFEVARTPEQLRALDPAEIDRLISTCSFHEAKAPQMWTIAATILDKYDGELPCDSDVLTSFKGVGPKCADLVLGIACQQPRVSVDVHVDRVTNRWGYVQTRTPEETMVALEEKLPQRYWVEINRLLVPFGKHICTGRRPHCSTCPVLEMCWQVAVGRNTE